MKGLVIFLFFFLSGFELGVNTVPNLISRAMNTINAISDTTGIHQFVCNENIIIDG